MFLMVIWWVMFCEVIPHVLTFCFPVYKENLLFNPVLHPIKSHIYCPGPFFLTVAVMIS